MKLLVSALENSANVHLKALHQELSDDVELIGIFDSSLGESIVDLRSLSIMGFVDALKKLRFFFKLADEMLELAGTADKVLLLDSSGFNLPLAKKIRKKYPEKEIIYYILPQAWAWKKKRIPVLEKTITHLASILPFEQDYYSKDAPISYVGHPLLDEIKLQKTALSENGKIVFMPGSRKGEIKRLMPIFHELRTRFKEDALLVVPSHFSKAELNEVYGNISDFIVTNNAHEALYEADFGFICSGTATLEAALIGLPFVLAYKASNIDYAIGSRVVKLDYVGLGNIIASKMNNEALFPELLQDAVTADALYEAYENMDKEYYMNNVSALRTYLKEGSSRNVAKLIETI